MTTFVQLLACAGLLGVCAVPLARAALPQGASAGDVTSDSAVLWARTNALGAVTFEWSRMSDFSVIDGSALADANQTAVPVKAMPAALLPGTQYYYRVTDAAGAIASGTFRTAPLAGTPRRGFRLGVSGDWRGELSPYPAVKNVPAADLDLFVKLGDTIYADVPSPAVPLPQCLTVSDFRTKQAEVYSTRFGLNALADLHASTAILSVIDDHEVTNDFAGGAPPASDPLFVGDPAPFINQTQVFNAGLQAFTDYNAIEDLSWSGTGDPRVDGVRNLYRARTYGRDAAVFLLDARSFRDEGLPPVANALDPNSVAAYLNASFDPSRTMLGHPQLAQLEADLLAAQYAGATWKFVCVPEPIQNLGVVAASDRFEGYAYERAALLRYIHANRITNVVFISADFHGTLINNITYSDAPSQPQIPVGAFEIVTGSVAYDAPFGPTIAALAYGLGLPATLPPAVYASLPPVEKETYLQLLINVQLQSLGYSLLGLQDATELRGVQLLAGSWTATTTYGWTEFDVDPVTQKLTVTTYGIPYYSAAELLADPAAIVAREPATVSQFSVLPHYRKGDVNCDGRVTFADIDPFVMALGGEAAFVAHYPACEWLSADANGDAVVNFADIDPFVGLLGQ